MLKRMSFESMNLKLIQMRFKAMNENNYSN